MIVNQEQHDKHRTMRPEPVKSTQLIKTTLAIALILFLGFSAIAAMYFKSYYDDAMRRMRHEADQEVAAVHASLYPLFIREVSISTSMAYDGFLISYLSNPQSYEAEDFERVIRNYLQGCMKTYHFDAAFLSLTKNNALYSHKGFERILSDDAASAWYNAALAHDRAYDINIDTDKFSKNERSIFVNCKIRDPHGNLLGIIGVCLHTDKIVDALKKFEANSGAKASLISEDGNIEISTSRKGFERVNWLARDGNDIFRDDIERAKTAGAHSAKIDFADVNSTSGNYVSGHYLPEIFWILIVEHPTGDFYDNLKQGMVSTLIVFIAVLIVVFLVIAKVIHRFEQEIRGMSEDRERNLAAMRDAMMLTLADLVERRDKNTGQHIRKTAAYVRIVLESLQRLGTFPDIINEDFIVKVVRSAPLHDIGKIMVPDAILNKPGKLTDEEYTLMKTHAAAGGEVIGHIISLVPDSDYLDIAKDIATHHHEKWNGKGYPDGLAGDAIPLAARVMAIADVFDALVSNRPYKKVFSIEKAFAILREESGQLFDPRIVDAFFAAEDEVIKVEKEIREPAPVEGFQQLMPRFL